MTNRLIEEAVRFLEKSTRINGGIVKEAKSPFPEAHVKSAVKKIEQMSGNGISSQDDIESAIHAHAKKLGYEGKDVQNFADHVHGVHADKTLPNKD